jgi:hypothetical protein
MLRLALTASSQFRKRTKKTLFPRANTVMNLCFSVARTDCSTLLVGMHNGAGSETPLCPLSPIRPQSSAK